jgi:hypothetical protein
MIDWLSVLFNALWVMGGALILAAFSHTHWLAGVRRVSLRRLLNTPHFQLPFTVGLTLISLGLLFLASTWLERGLWAIFTLLFTWQLWQSWQTCRD